VVVQSDLTDANAFRGFGELHEIVRGHIEFLVCIVRMRSYSAEYIGIIIRDAKQIVELPDPRGDGHHTVHTRLLRTSQNGREVFLHPFEIKVAMAVHDAHQTFAASSST
jgi:hypothetical protein